MGGGAVKYTEKDRVVCRICGADVQRVQSLQVTCGAEPCRVANGLREPDFPRGATFECAVCGRTSPVRQSTYRTCGDTRCKAAWRSRKRTPWIS